MENQQHILSFLGIRYVRSLPILAGSIIEDSGSIKRDAVGRQVQLQRPPLPTYFLNLGIDPDLYNKYGSCPLFLDYILGNSDSTNVDKVRLVNGSFVYWVPANRNNLESIQEGDALVISYNIANCSSDTTNDPKWNCLRRAKFSSLSGDRLDSKSDKIYITWNFDGKIQELKIDKRHIRGVVVASNNSYRKQTVLPLPGFPFK